MRVRKGIVVAAAISALAAGIGVTIEAATVTNGPITVTYPGYPLSGPALVSCEPWTDSTAKEITISGIPLGSNVMVTFIISSPLGGSSTTQTLNFQNVQGGSLTVPVGYQESANWPLWNPTTNERAIAIATFVIVSPPNATPIKISTKTWWIRCLPPPPPAQGCTPGYWRQDQHFDSWVGYVPGDDFEVVFGVDSSFDPHTLLDAVWLGGGGENALARHAVAALLNAAAGLSYPLDVNAIIAGVQNAYATQEFEAFKDLLDAYNNAGCPLN